MSSVEQDAVTLALAHALSKFTLFPKLPLELRLKIFNHALPTGPQGIRMLKVAANKLITNSTIEVGIKSKSDDRQNNNSKSENSFLTFRLLHHQHNTYIQDLGLLRACSASRDVYLKRFTGSLRVGETSIIRFAKEDIVYIANMEYLLRNPQFRQMLYNKTSVEGVPFQNLALHPDCFRQGYNRKAWDPDHLIHWGGYFRFFAQCKDLMIVGAVLDDLDAVAGEDSGLPAWAAWQQVAFDYVGEVKTLWEGAKAKLEQKMPELCVWNLDGNQVADENQQGQASNAP